MSCGNGSSGGKIGFEYQISILEGAFYRSKWIFIDFSAKKQFNAKITVYAANKHNNNETIHQSSQPRESFLISGQFQLKHCQNIRAFHRKLEIVELLENPTSVQQITSLRSLASNQSINQSLKQLGLLTA
jgi:hypothetical protein